MVGKAESGVPVQDGIRQIKSTLTNQIFRQELLHVYEQKSTSRDELVAEARKAMLELAKAMREMTCIHPEAEQMIWNLSRQLAQVAAGNLRLSAKANEKAGG